MNLTTDRNQTYGYEEMVGQWSIDLGQSDRTSVESLPETANRAVKAFVESFADICRVRDADGVLTTIGADGRILDVQGEVPLVQLGDPSFGPAGEEGPGEGALRLLTSFTVRCDVLVHEDGEVVACQNGLDFYYESGLDTVTGEPVRFRSAYVSVVAHVDPWVDAPRRGARVLDNKPTAALNRPRLERALRRWEALVGRPISEANSRAYPTLIYRYGFRSSG